MASNLPTLFTGTLLLLLASANSFRLPISAAMHAAQKPHFVLVHGFGHGAWCWYKVITLLEAAGNSVTAIDLTSNGISKVEADTVTSVAQYTKPLTDFLATTTEKVILVGHSLGGSSVSYAMEFFPEKISKAVFLGAFMPANGQSLEGGPELEIAIAKALETGVLIGVFANGPSEPPTSAYINLTSAQSIFYNESPPEDVNLAYTVLNPTPLRPLSYVLRLTSSKYGSIRRFYIRTGKDHIIPPSLQKVIIEANPPERVYEIKESDHSAFFSQPKALVKLLLTIASSD